MSALDLREEAVRSQAGKQPGGGGMELGLCFKEISFK